MSAILKALRRVEGEKKERAASERLHGEVTGEASSPPGQSSRAIRISGLGALLFAVVAAGFWLRGAETDPADPLPPAASESAAEAVASKPAKVPVAPPSRQPTVAEPARGAEVPAEAERLSIAEYRRLHMSPTAGSPPAPEYVPPPPPAPPAPPPPEPAPPPAPKELAAAPPKPAKPLLPGGAYPSRQAPASPAQQTGSAAAPSPVGLPGVRVLQTVWHPVADKRVAFVALGSDGEAIELHEGEAWRQWSVAEIKLSSVVFEQGDQRVVRKVGARP